MNEWAKTLALVFNVLLVFYATSTFARSTQGKAAKVATDKVTVDKLTMAKVKLGEVELKVEVADTPLTRERGLMFRKSLPENRGMLFIFESFRQVSFWMKNTYIPLSIAFFDKSCKVTEILYMDPESILVQKLKQYRSSRPTKFALEVNRGWFRKNKIKAGTSLKFLNSSKGSGPLARYKDC